MSLIEITAIFTLYLLKYLYSLPLRDLWSLLEHLIISILKRSKFITRSQICNTSITAFQYNWFPCNPMCFMLHIYKHSEKKTTGIITLPQLSIAHTKSLKTPALSLRQETSLQSTCTPWEIPHLQRKPVLICPGEPLTP